MRTCITVAGSAAAVVLIVTAIGLGQTAPSAPGAGVGSSPQAQGASGAPRGVIYTSTDFGDKNEVLAYRYDAGGRMTLLGRYATGGKGIVDVAPALPTGLPDGDSQVVVDRGRRLLYAVNQGSDTIAAFHIASDGKLTPVSGSPFPSGGPNPISMTIAGRVLVVANQGNDPVRDVSKRKAGYQAFTIGSDGGLTLKRGAFRSAPPGALPSQVAASPDGRFAFGTDFTAGVLRSFQVGQDDSLRDAPASPQQVDPRSFPAKAALLRIALGVFPAPSGNLLYVLLPIKPHLAVYRYSGSSGKLTYVTAIPLTNAALACWLRPNAAGTRLYTSNNGQDTVSVIDSSNPTRPRQLQSLQLKGQGLGPVELELDPTGSLLFVLKGGHGLLPGDKSAPATLRALSIGGDGRVADVNPPAVLPVSISTNPQGVALFPLGGG